MLVCSAIASRANAEPPRASIARELAVSMGTTTLLSPAVYTGARFVGESSPSLLTSALPAVLLAAALPPAIAAGALSFERSRDGARSGFVKPYLYALGAQVLVLAGSFLAKTWVAEPKDLMLMSLATGLATGGAATLGAEIHFR
ncbi:MAG: hypothetical protein KIT84_22790 [Labilithrix sp.]|nr:hypothetical protein [Labilithrix sp.]MCW5813873.1 hypothetical protein [Labilithrix sp.]